MTMVKSPTLSIVQNIWFGLVYDV